MRRRGEAMIAGLCRKAIPAFSRMAIAGRLNMRARRRRGAPGARRQEARLRSSAMPSIAPYADHREVHDKTGAPTNDVPGSPDAGGKPRPDRPSDGAARPSTPRQALRQGIDEAANTERFQPPGMRLADAPNWRAAVATAPTRTSCDAGERTWIQFGRRLRLVQDLQ